MKLSTVRNRLVSQLNPVEFVIFTINTFVLAFIVAKFAVMKYAPVQHANVESLLFAALIASIFCSSIFRSIDFRIGQLRKVDIALVSIVAGAVFYIFVLYKNGLTLPANDPIADPTFGSVIFRGIALNNYYGAGQSGHAYPPGVPLLLSVANASFGTLGALATFKLMCLFSVALMPLSWGYATKSVFNLKTSLAVIVALFYVAAFGFERTINYTLPFAGKNSQLIMLAAFPLFLVQFIKLAEASIATLICTGIAFAGLIFVHYSAIHLAVGLIGSIFISTAYQNRDRPEFWLKIFWRFSLMGVLGIAIFLLLFAQAIHDPRSTLGAHTQLPTAIHVFFSTFFSPNESPLTIFNRPSFQQIGSPARGFFLISSVVFSWSVIHIIRDEPMHTEAKNIFFSNACFLSTIIIAVAFGSGLINVGASLDFSRWFVFPAEFAVFGCGALSGYLLLRRIFDLKAALGCALSFLIFPAVLFYSDTQTIAPAARYGVLSKNQISSLQKIFVSTPHGCYVAAPSTDADKGLSYAQKYRLLEYLEAATNCLIVNGSWVHGPYPGWRSAMGLPRTDAILSAPTGSVFYFVGTKADLDANYPSLHWIKVAPLPEADATVWTIL